MDIIISGRGGRVLRGENFKRGIIGKGREQLYRRINKESKLEGRKETMRKEGTIRRFEGKGEGIYKRSRDISVVGV